jgi:hypothetical protein
MTPPPSSSSSIFSSFSSSPSVSTGNELTDRSGETCRHCGGRNRRLVKRSNERRPLLSPRSPVRPSRILRRVWCSCGFLGPGGAVQIVDEVQVELTRSSSSPGLTASYRNNICVR